MIRIRNRVIPDSRRDRDKVSDLQFAIDADLTQAKVRQFDVAGCRQQNIIGFQVWKIYNYLLKKVFLTNLYAPYRLKFSAKRWPLCVPRYAIFSYLDILTSVNNVPLVKIVQGWGDFGSVEHGHWLFEIAVDGQKRLQIPTNEILHHLLVHILLFRGNWWTRTFSLVKTELMQSCDIFLILANDYLWTLIKVATPKRFVYCFGW